MVSRGPGCNSNATRAVNYPLTRLLLESSVTFTHDQANSAICAAGGSCSSEYALDEVKSFVSAVAEELYEAHKLPSLRDYPLSSIHAVCCYVSRWWKSLFFDYLPQDENEDVESESILLRSRAESKAGPSYSTEKPKFNEHWLVLSILKEEYGRVSESKSKH